MSFTRIQSGDWDKVAERRGRRSKKRKGRARALVTLWERDCRLAKAETARCLWRFGTHQVVRKVFQCFRRTILEGA